MATCIMQRYMLAAIGSNSVTVDSQAQSHLVKSVLHNQLTFHEEAPY